MATPSWRPPRLWTMLQEPRAITALMVLAYGLVLVIGVAALAQPPSSITHALGWVTRVWAGCLLAGGLLGVAAAPKGLWWIERLAIIAALTGTAIYLSTVLQLHFAQAGNRIPQAGFISITLVTFIVRWTRIRYAALDPTK